MTSSASSLVLGVATGLSPPFFEPFALSLRATGYRGRMGLVLAGYDEATTRALGQLADFSVTVDQEYGAVNASALRVLAAIRTTRRVRRGYPLAFSLAARTRERNRLSRWRTLELRLEGLQALRYTHYYDVLHREGLRADQILLTDVRDVLFQRDPFETPVCGLEVFLQESDMTIGRDVFTRRWMIDLYGRDEVTALEGVVTSCSGTVAGSRESILRYLKEMCQEITWRRRPLGSHDQAVHNHLLRQKRFDPVAIVTNGYGRVLTMAGMSDIRRDAAGRVLNRDDTVPAVLHQYDRHPSLAHELVTALGSSV